MGNLYTTGYLKLETQNVESLEEYKQEVVTKLQDWKKIWIEKFNEILENYSISKMAEICGVSRQSVMKWRDGISFPTREKFVRIGLAAGYDHQQMNDFLERYGRYPKLYPKSLEDSIVIFVLEKDDIPNTYESYKQISKRILQELVGVKEQKNSDSFKTSEVLSLILENDTEEELLEFIKERLPVFKEQFYKLYKKIKAYIKINLDNGNMKSYTELAAGWSSSLHNCMTEINNGTWYPKRDKLISLGINLNMDIDQIDELLETAYMKPLYSKNIFENAIIFAMTRASKDETFVEDYESNLSSYVYRIFLELDISEVEFFLTEIEE